MIDLHIHSTCSDGTLTPTQLIRLAEEIGLEAVALCDHNTVAGLPEFLSAAKDSPVEAVPGIEFSTDYRDRELHLLGLFIHPEHYAAVTELVDDMLRWKEESNLLLVKNLRAVGIHLDYAAIKAATPNGQVNRALIAAEMLRQGYCESIQDAFARWLSPKHGHFVPPKRLDVFDTIRFLKSIGAVAVLAHPFLNLKEEGPLREFLEQAKEAGLDGMEVYYPKFSPENTDLACRLAEEYGLLKSGGSDFHGDNKPDIAMGTGRGSLNISRKILEALRKRQTGDGHLCVRGTHSKL